MKWIRSVWAWISLWLTSLFAGRYTVRVVNEDLPPILKRRVLYVVEEDGFEEFAALLCPCRCGEILYLNLLADERPRWKLLRNPSGTATLMPSVWRRKGCMSHFWLRDGHVTWCPPRNRQAIAPP